MLLYHGSNQPIPNPIIILPNRGLDFGAGFYLTSNEEQARRFSQIVMKRRKTGVPTISVYEFNESLLKSELETLKFSEPNASWLEFVRDNRLTIYHGKQYDVIIGPVANDRIYPTIQALIIGQLSVEAAIVELRSKKLFDQYCFATESAIVKLKFVSSIEPED